MRTPTLPVHFHRRDWRTAVNAALISGSCLRHPSPAGSLAWSRGSCRVHWCCGRKGRLLLQTPEVDTLDGRKQNAPSCCAYTISSGPGTLRTPGQRFFFLMIAPFAAICDKLRRNNVTSCSASRACPNRKIGPLCRSSRSDACPEYVGLN